MNSQLIALIESQQDRLREYFQDYLKVQDLERLDLEKEHYEDLQIHLDVEQRILNKILRLSKIIDNHITDLKLRDLDDCQKLLRKQSDLESLKELAIRNNLDNQKALEKRKNERPKFVFSYTRKRNPLSFEGRIPQIVNLSI